MISRRITPHRPGRRYITAIAVGGLLTSILLAGGVVLAVNNTGAFELDGNAVNGVAAGDDWDNVCHQVLGTDCSTSNNTNGATAVSFIDTAAEPVIFTGGGSKDPQDPQDQWLWKPSDTIPDKDTINHAFAARYSLAPSAATCPSNGDPTCEVIFFGSDRFDNSGDAQLGFWFFKNEVKRLDPASTSGSHGFSGHHANGDLLIISDFSGGGTTSTISAYFWNTSCKKADTSKNPVLPYCGAPNLQLQATSDAANCAQSAATASFCGIVNTADGTTAPWAFTDKSGNHTYLNGEFYEAGVNLSKLGIGGTCFASFEAESRASTSPTATLKALAIGGFGHCDTTIETTPSPGQGGDTSITTTGLATVHDSATLTVTGALTWTGTLKFYLCGPIATGTCDTGGTLIDTKNNVTQATSQPIVSADATVSSVGRYCFRGEFISGTTGVPSKTDSSENECFTVSPVTPTLTTTASADVTLGGSISDVVHLGGTAPQPGSPIINGPVGSPAGGSITVTAYGPGDCTTLAHTFAALPVSGNGDYTTAGWAPLSAGVYHFKASYTNSTTNTNGQTATGCPDDTEDVTVGPVTPTLTTQSSTDPVLLGSKISDTAHLTGTANKPNGSPAGGTISFTAYGPGDCTTVAFGPVTINVSGDGFYGGAGSAAEFTPTATGKYTWVASYSGDSPNTSAAGPTACPDANEDVTVNQIQPTLSTAQWFYPNDDATVTATGGGNLAGTVHFQAFESSDCGVAGGDSAILSQDVGVSGATTKTVSTTNTTVKTTAANISWKVSYTSTNPAQKSIAATCVEHTVLTITNS